MTDEELSNLDGKTMLLKTAGGTPVSLGRLRVEPRDDLRASRRVSVQFETEVMHCVLGIPAARLADLIKTWDGAMYNYTLPSGDGLWAPRRETPRAPVAQGEPIVETFPPPARPDTSKTKPMAS